METLQRNIYIGPKIGMLRNTIYPDSGFWIPETFDGVVVKQLIWLRLSGLDCSFVDVDQIEKAVCFLP